MEIDLNSYLQKVVNPDDLEIFTEALECISHNSLRAGYVMTWISIVESLKHKLHLLSAMDSNVAKEGIGKIEKLEKDEQSADKTIVEYAKKCGIISPEKHHTTDFLWTQRCLFGHPYEKKPTEIEVIHCLEQALEITIGKELFFNKNIIEEKLDRLISQPHIIENDIDKIEEYAESFVSKIRDDEYFHTYKMAMQRIMTLLDEPDSNIWVIRRLRSIVQCILSKPEVDFKVTKWGFETSVDKHPYVTWVTAVNKDTWEKFTDSMQDRLVNFAVAGSKKDGYTIYKYIFSVYNHMDSVNRNYQKLTDYYEALPFPVFAQHYPNVEFIYRRMLVELDTGDYARENGVWEFVTSKTGMFYLQWLTPTELVPLGRRLIVCERNNNYKSKQIWTATKTNNFYKFPDDFLAGTFLGHFSRANSDFYFPGNPNAVPFSILNNLSENTFKVILANFKGIVTSSPQETFCLYSDKIRELLKLDLSLFTGSVYEIVNSLLKILLEKLADCEENLLSES